MQIKFIGNLTNVYVRYNRKRLKGGKGPADTLMALTCLFNVLLDVTKVNNQRQRKDTLKPKP